MLRVQKVVTFSGLDISADCGKNEVENCMMKLHESGGVKLIETMRSAIVDNLQQLEQHQQRLLAALSGKLLSC